MEKREHRVKWKQPMETPERLTLAGLLNRKGLAQTDGGRLQELEAQNRNLQQQIDDLQRQLAATAPALASETDSKTDSKTDSNSDSTIDLEALFERGLTALKDDQPEEALEWLAAVAALDPHHIKARINLAVVFADLGFSGKARRLLEQVLNLAPDHALARHNLKLLQPD